MGIGWMAGTMALPSSSVSYPKDVIQQQIDLHAASWGKETDEDGNPIMPAIQPMPKEWMPPGVTPE